MKKFGVTGVVILGMFLISVLPVFAATLTWGETYPNGNTDVQWTDGAFSDNGQVILASSASRLYVSTNGGSSWNETRPAGNSDFQWNTVAVSADGQTMLAAVVGGRIYLSTNAGTNWAETQPAGNSGQDWYSTVISDNGQIMLAGAINARLWLSTNGGANWAETRPAGNVNEYWIGVAMSSNGQTMLAGNYGGRVHVSTNGGTNWSEVSPAGSVDRWWWTAKVSGDGQTMIIGGISTGGRLYTSTNAGSNWTEKTLAGNIDANWYTSAISSDGQKLVAGHNGGRLYLSTDQSTSWNETQPAGDANKSWLLSDITPDGINLLAGVNGGRFYLGQFITPTTSNGSPPLTAVTCTDATPSSVPDLFQITTEKSSALLNFTTVKGASGYRVMYGLTPDATQYGDMFGYSGPAWVIDRKINYLVPNMTYYFKVQAANGCNGSAWSKVMSARIRPGAAATSNQVLGVTTTAGDTSSCTYTIVGGDSLWKIAKDKWGNGAKYRDVLDMNSGLREDSVLRIGQILKVCK